MCYISDLTIKILENFELEKLNNEEKNNILQKQEDFWIHTVSTAYFFGLNNHVAKYGDMSHVIVK